MEFITLLILLCLFLPPAGLTLWNLFDLGRCLLKRPDRERSKYIELAALVLGFLYLLLYLGFSDDYRFANWDVQLYNSEVHSMVEPASLPTVLVLLGVSFVGWCLIRLIPAAKQPPLLSAFGIAALYLGLALNLVWCVQTWHDRILCVYPLNCVLLSLKTILLLVREKNALILEEKVSLKYPKLATLLNRGSNLPWLGLLLAVPLLGILIAILFLFGQRPDSFIRAWTETADWTLSQRIAPQNIYYDEHYLCTVAAGGHRRIVKPLRSGLRHGHPVLVNRQLCIANAFEQVLMEHMPHFHHAVRSFYDSFGYPIARHIRSRYAADLIYFVMKPLEWLFLLVLYAVDVKPENRIAVQYPHAPLPKE